MKIKSLTNKGDVIGATIGYTVMLLFFFGGVAVKFNNMLWLIPFFIGLKLLLFFMLKRLKGVIFYTDKLEVSNYGLSDSKMIFEPADVVLKKLEGSARLPRNAFNIYINGKRVGMFRLNEYEGQFEKFREETNEAGYVWKRITT